MHHFCVTVSFTSPNETREERDITKFKPLGHSEMQNIGNSKYVDEYSQHNGQSYTKLSTHEWNKYKYIYHQT